MKVRLLFDGIHAGCCAAHADVTPWGHWDKVSYEDMGQKQCNGQPPSRFSAARCGVREKHAPHSFSGTVVIDVRRGEVIEVDLDDGSGKAVVMRDFLERGICHVQPAP